MSKAAGGRNVLVIGASGYIGGAVAEHLRAAGHRVVATQRSGGSAPRAADEVRVADLTDPASLTAAVTPDIDVVVHAGVPSGDEALDAAGVDALLAPLRGTGRGYVHTSGVWVVGNTGARVADETTATDPLPIVGYRPRIEQRVLAAAADGVRASVLRPGVVHGRGAGMPAMLVDWAAEHGIGCYVGDPGRWAVVHVDDLADLYVAAVEHAPAGEVLHGVGEDGVSTVELAAAASRAAGVRQGAQSWAFADAAAVFGEPFAQALAIDQRVSAGRTRELLGWAPSRPGIVADLVSGSYGRVEQAA